MRLYSIECRLLNVVVVFGHLITVTRSACICPPELSFWEAPCGTKVVQMSDVPSAGEIRLRKDISKPKIWRRMIQKSLKSLQHEMNLALYGYGNWNFKEIYSNVDGALESNRQYIPSWLPGRGDVETMAADIKSIKEIPKSLQIFYTDLQKFAVAFEQAATDEKNQMKSNAIKSLNNGLALMLCEIKSILQDLQVSVPMVVQRSIMPENERHLTDYSRQLIRDYGSVKRYGDYLEQWSSLLKSVKRRKRRSVTTTTSAGRI